MQARYEQSDQHVKSRDLELQKRERSLQKACSEIQRLESSLLSLTRDYEEL